jgi:threonine aldolase
MIRFNCDYLEGTHPRILQALAETNMVQTCGYGEDEYCEAAREAIKKVCKCESAQVHFLVGGTQANLTVISSILRPHQAVLCVKEGHINVHETGAIEATGHKVLAIEGKDGKLSADQIREQHKLHWEDGSHEHIAQPKLVYISNPTDLGTIYTKSELEAIRKACDECNLYLFLDGARLGYGLMSKDNDMTIEDIAKNCDVFYIGGTKVGALFGEAVVITNPALQEDFRYIIKQKGGMLAKGRLLGIQFLELFKDGLYFEISAHAMKMAEILKEGLEELGYKFYANSPTNQQFVIVSDKKLQELDAKYSYEYQMRYDAENSVVRFCTSWATQEEHVRQLLENMK